ncbi:non-ribosomal peptide synthetase module [Pontibacillus halophilus JSM 076056 = DSM 19796]|uniref:Non-ribosomal peptide synthetase module n=1 Tax=Pontibacillus halophilus JSM 076056 = DSM 19796 TaxID=1385510 RepID=A0A0A5GJW6_9BACI|nr:hypothetical protein [Pontibacillus halophilus]KGX92309.1 non-ribosomal peptide synthetase module [Pontibacillus halophilus JSM 076056 = DSM 19796]
MQWSKTKSTLESFLCEKLKGRIELHATVYRKFHDRPARVWITFDKEEILSASDVTFQVHREKLYRQMIESRKVSSAAEAQPGDSLNRQEYNKAFEQSEEVMVNESIFESYHLYEPFMRYPSLSIEDAMNSENVIIVGLAMFDRRLGKRRLRMMETNDRSHPFVEHCYKIRCRIEGMNMERVNETHL